MDVWAIVFIAVILLAGALLFRGGHRIAVRPGRDGTGRIGHVRRTRQQQYQRSRMIGGRGRRSHPLPSLPEARVRKLRDLAGTGHAERECGYKPSREAARAKYILWVHGHSDSPHGE